ncbi:MAG: LacI family DNA-binding transcriptional regulator [Corynebacterium sp.]|nr:LacI family DNA-binding transcriptional regulator [Corynebacterium sp.]
MARVTLATIAATLGISRTTVSNAYNKPEELSPQLRKKILDTAKELGYPGPHPAARSLRTQRTGSIGVLFTDYLTYAFEDIASRDFLAGIAEASYGSSNGLTLIPAGPEDFGDDILLNNYPVDGYIVYSVAADDPYLLSAKNLQVPVVICDQPAGMADLPFVGIDDFHAIQPAAQALVEAGHRKIGILSIRLDRKPNNGVVEQQRLQNARLHVQRSRVLGALEVFAAHGIDQAEVPIIERHINDATTAYDAAREMLESFPDRTAILCTTDSQALGVLAYAAEAGIRVPEDLSVTGFDGIAPALDCGLTTVIQPNKRKGAAAAHLLQGLIDASLAERASTPEKVYLPTNYFKGLTVAPPKE